LQLSQYLDPQLASEAAAREQFFPEAVQLDEQPAEEQPAEEQPAEEHKARPRGRPRKKPYLLTPL